jgi:Uma2 family endonuclease
MAAAYKLLTELEFLERERARDVRHEFVDGAEYAMAGASRAHVLLQAALISTLRPILRGRGCDVGGSDMRLKPGARFYYPDLVGFCRDSPFLDDAFDTLLDASLVVEILSQSTERIDRGEKFEAYRRLRSFSEYLLVDARRVQIEQFVREGDSWGPPRMHAPGDVVVLASFPGELVVDAIYEGIELDRIR